MKKLLALLALAFYFNASVFADTSKIAFSSRRDGNYEIYAMNTDGTNPARLTNNSDTDWCPAWSSDGSKIAFQSDRDGNFEIYVMNADGTGQTRLTNSPARDEHPSWSPDGSKIVYASDWKIYVMNADGTGQTCLSTNSNGDNWPSWSHDGSKIAFVSDRDGNLEVYVMNADGTNQARLTNNSYYDSYPAWSSDGAKIAFQSDRGSLGIYVMNANGTGQTLLTDTTRGTWPSWSPDDSKIAFSSDRESPFFEIYTINTNGTDLTRLTNNSADDFYPAWGSGQTSSIAVTSPNGGESWTALTSHNITWTSSGVTNVKLEYTTDNGTNWTTIVENTTAAGTYAWTVPNTPSTQCLVQVSDASKEAVNDASNGLFTIKDFMPTMVSIANGMFQMGQVGVYGGEPVHIVAINVNNFQVSATEITQGQYISMIGSNPSHFTGNDTLPVEMVTWFEAIKYCNALSVIAGLQQCYNEITGDCDFTKNGFRLPTDAEWEYACRAGTTTNYYTGHNESDLAHAGWYSMNSGSTTHPVGEKTPNAWGLYDMHGNAWEWCNDCFESYSSGSSNNPTGTQSGGARVIRGGSCIFNPGYCYSAFRERTSPSERESFPGYCPGFRVVRGVHVPVPFILTSPNGGEYCNPNTTRNISWISSGVTYAMLEYSTNNGTSWTTIVVSTPTAAGFYSWTVPNIISTNCKIRISDPFNSGVSDQSDGVFTIENAPTLADTSWPMFRQNIQHTGRGITTVAASSTVKWKFQLTSSYYNPYGLDSSPAIGSDGTVYVGSYDTYLYAVKTDGTLKWKFQTFGNIRSSPAIGSDGTVYVGGDNDTYLYAVKSDGTLKWKFQTGNYVRSSPAIGSDGTVYIGSADGYLYAVRSDGTLKWKFQTWGIIEFSSPAIGSDGTVYVGTAFSLFALNSDGTLKWYFETGGWVYSSPAIGSDGTVYVGSGDGGLYAVRSDGTLKWKLQTDGWVLSSPALGSDGTVYVGSRDSNLYAVTSNGTLKWTYLVGGWVFSSPTIGSDGTVYVGTEYGYFHAIKSDGTLKWKFQTGVNPILGGYGVCSSPAIGADGTVYVGSWDTYLYAFAPEAAPLTVSSPNGGESWTAGTSHKITWTSSGVTNVKLDYSTNNGSTWTMIIPSTAAAVGSYAWSVPDTTSTQCLVKISDVSNLSVNDVSDAVFSILGTVTVKSPNGGEKLISKTKHPITWTSVGISKVLLEFSSDNGATWSGIANNVDASSGTHLWTIPNIESTQCLVRISDMVNPAINDNSDATFSIMPVCSLITELINKVNALVTPGGLNKGNSNALTVKLEGAIDKCNTGNYSVMVNQLGAFINQVEAFRGKKLTVTQTDDLIADANKIIQIILEIQGLAKPVLSSETAVELPKDFSLSQNSPNPFNPITTIQYAIPAGKGGIVRLTIYDSRGVLVRTLVEGVQNPGIHTATWNATDDSGRRISSGIYIYRLEAGSFTQTRKMLLLR